MIKHHNSLKELGVYTCIHSIPKNKGVVVTVDTTKGVSRAEITLGRAGKG